MNVPLYTVFLLLSFPPEFLLSKCLSIKNVVMEQEQLLMKATNRGEEEKDLSSLTMRLMNDESSSVCDEYQYICEFTLPVRLFQCMRNTTLLQTRA